MKIFGCLCYAYNHQRPKDKFESRSRKCVFIGYPHGKKGWKVYDLETGNMFVSRNVIFEEHTFPFGENLEDNAPSMSQKEYHLFWECDKVKDDDWKSGQHLVGSGTPTAGLSPPETVGNFGSSSSAPGPQPLTGLSSTGPESQPTSDDKGSPRSGPV